MKYAHIDKNNKLLGWYSDDIHDIIPEPNIQVTDEQWQDALNNMYNKINSDGSGELFDFRTEEQIIKEELNSKLLEYKTFLKETDWIESYHIKHLLNLEIIPENSSKWDIISKRTDYIEFIKNNI